MPLVSVKKEKYILEVTLNQPDIHNAFDPAMIAELNGIFKNIPEDVRGVLLQGKGKSFCSGANLEWMKSMVDFSLKENIVDSKNLFEMFRVIRDCPVPVIAKVHGNVMGGGVGLVACSDIVAADKDTKFCFSEVRLGLVPSVISSFVLSKARDHLAREVMMTAEIFDCEMAASMGLLNFFGEPEEVNDYVQGKFDFIVNNGPEAMRSLKHILNFVKSHGPQEVMEESARIIAERRMSKEGQAGLRAFFEKKSPPWKAR